MKEIHLEKSTGDLQYVGQPRCKLAKPTVGGLKEIHHRELNDTFLSQVNWVIVYTE